MHLPDIIWRPHEWTDVGAKFPLKDEYDKQRTSIGIPVEQEDVITEDATNEEKDNEDEERHRAFPLGYRFAGLWWHFPIRIRA